MNSTPRSTSKLIPVLAVVLLCVAGIFGAGPAAAAGGVKATATIDGKAISGANAQNPVRLDPNKVTPVVVEVTNTSSNPVTVRRVDLTGHVMGLNFFSYSTSVELTVAAGKTEKLTYRLDPAGLDGQATGLIGSDLTLIGSDGKPLTSVHTVIDVRGSLVSVYGLFGIILAVLTALAIADAALTVARHRLSANRFQRGLRLLAPGIGLGLMIGFTASIARWWVPGAVLWLGLAGGTAAWFFLAGYFSPTPRTPDDLGLDLEDLAAAHELDAHGYPAGPDPIVTYNLDGPHVAPVDPYGDVGSQPTVGLPSVRWRADQTVKPTVGAKDPHPSQPLPTHPYTDPSETIGRESAGRKVSDDEDDEPTIRSGPQGFQPGGSVR
ncbi:hypothetical protein AB0N05_24280 [Nocardia sp. NPDC051030]|uniref:hypothetical protein n=1 Tax=Nocardia sp. NPDC051030 TaxID=3155162 RepID=UPI00343373D7